MKLRRLSLLLLGLFVATLQPASAQMFLRLDGMVGSSADTNHAGWMAINSIQQGVRRGISTPAGSGRQVSSPSFSMLTVTKTMDSASPRLAWHAVGGGGDVINSGTIDLVRVDATHARYLRLNLTNILLSAYSVSGVGGAPSETVTLAPLVVSWNYTLYGPTSGLPKAYESDTWELAQDAAVGASNAPVFTATGIRVARDVELDWIAKVGQSYRIYAVLDLQQPFQLLKEITATAAGATNYVFTPGASAMFYAVEEVPSGY